MSPIRLARRFLPTVAISLASTLLMGGRASAQQPRPVYVAPDVKGFQTQRMLQQSAQQPTPAGPRIPFAPPATAAGAVTPQAPSVQLTLTFPSVQNKTFVAIRGPDGEVRYFPVEGGQEGTRVIVVRPGERVFIQLPPPSPK